MKVHTFRRGVHPHDHKAETENCQIKVIFPKEGEELLFPLAQHIGPPCEPLVQPGQRVLVGERIADCDKPMGVPIHSSVSGVVKEIRETAIPNGNICKAIVVVNDGQMEESVMVGTENYLSFTKEQYLEKIRAAGIVGLGGAGFPTHIKLNPPADKAIDYIIVNASECEPYLTTDYRVLLEQSYELKRGLQVILKMFPGSKGIIGIETNKPAAIKRMEEVCKDDERINVYALKPKYPQGSEKQLIEACTGRQVPSGKLPADAGCIVENVDTVIAIDRCVHRGRPLMRKVVTVVGGALEKPGNFKVRLGMTYRSLIEAAGGFKTEPAKVISGGPMMGAAMYDLNVPTIKTSSAVLCLTAGEAQIPPETGCIRCGKCVEHCPVGLMPLDLNQYALRGEDDLFRKHNGMECIECGSCSWICPAKRHLAQSIRAKRRTLMARKK